MNKQAVGQVARDADINRKHITAHGAGDGADACFPADKVFRDDGCHLLTCLRHAFFDDTVVRAEYDDTSPVQSSVEQVPFHCVAEARGIREDSVYQLDAGLEQLSAVMMGGDMVEVKAVIALDFLVLQPVCEPVITGAAIHPMDLQKLQELPGIVGYIVQPEDSLWEIAKKFHTTVGNIISTNELADDQVKQGQRLLLVKEIAQGL